MNDVLLPFPEHFQLLNYLMVMALLINLPYMGMLIGSTFFSVFFRGVDRIEPNEKARVFGKDILDIIPCNIGVGIILGIIPLLAIMLLYSQWFYETAFQLHAYFKVILGIITVGSLFQWIYHRSVDKENNSLIINGIGALSFMILVIGYFIFISTLSLSFSPEHWKLLKTPVPLVFNANSAARFLLFFMISFAFTGVGLLVFWFRKHESSLSESYRKFVRGFGGGLTLVSVFLVPLLFLWHLITLPLSVFSSGLFIIYIIALIFLSRVGLKTYYFLADATQSVNKKSLVYLVLFLFFLLTGDHLAKDTANSDHKSVLLEKSEAYRLALEDQRGAHQVVTADATLGKEVYQTRCVTCHEYTTKKVGPPHKEIIEKYRNDRELLKKFIKAPWKVSPDYPAMPAQPLNRKELESVVLYMMEYLGKEKNEVTH